MQDVLEALEDMREYDVPYHVRVAIDTDLRAGHWFTVSNKVRLFSYNKATARDAVHYAARAFDSYCLYAPLSTQSVMIHQLC